MRSLSREPKIGGFQFLATAKRTIVDFETMLWLEKGFWRADRSSTERIDRAPLRTRSGWSLSAVPEERCDWLWLCDKTGDGVNVSINQSRGTAPENRRENSAEQ